MQSSGEGHLQDEDSEPLQGISGDEDNPVPHIPGSRKRRLPSEDNSYTDDKLLPAAAAMKKRRIQEENEARRKGVSVEAYASKASEPTPPTKPKIVKKEVDIQEAVRERREAEEEAAKRDEEFLGDTIKGMTVEEMQNLSVVEDMEVMNKASRTERTRGPNDRWDERWNGRKNFKRFRRQGSAGGPRRGHAVIVPLEEVNKQGVNEDTRMESERAKRRRKEKEKERQQERGRMWEEQSPNQTFTSAQSHQEEIPTELGGGEHETIDVDAPRTTRLRDKTSQVEQESNEAHGLGSKRPAPSDDGRRVVVAKKQRTLMRDDSSNSDDELKFRFRSRR